MGEMILEDVSSNDAGVFSSQAFIAYQELLRESIATDPTGAVYVVGELANAVHDGSAFTVNASGTIAGSGGTVLLLGRTGAKDVHFDHFHVDVSKGLISLALYEAPTVTADGTPIIAVNRNRKSTNVATMATFAGTTVSDNGALLENTTIYSTGGVGSNLSGGKDNISGGWLLAPNTEYLIVITNNDTTDTLYTGNFVWSERPVV